MRALGVALSLSALVPAATEGQSVRSAVGRDTIRVGDVVPIALRITVDRDARVAWPDTLPLAGTELENAARVRERVDTLEDGRLQRTAIYSVIPWRPGELSLPEVPVPVVAADEAVETRTARPPALDVASVLPPDTAGIEPRPAKDVIGANRAWWPILLALLLLAALILAILWWLRRRRAAVGPAMEPAVPPRERTLARLDEVRTRFLEGGDVRGLYTGLAAAVRGYAAALDPTWGEDLTTTELLARLRAGPGPAPASRLAEVLRPADQVKFARRSPDRDTALEEWGGAHDWVAGFEWPPPPADERGVAA